jgi:hypothetical protein
LPKCTFFTSTMSKNFGDYLRRLAGPAQRLEAAHARIVQQTNNWDGGEAAQVAERLHGEINSTPLSQPDKKMLHTLLDNPDDEVNNDAIHKRMEGEGSDLHNFYAAQINDPDNPGFEPTMISATVQAANSGSYIHPVTQALGGAALAEMAHRTTVQKSDNALTQTFHSKQILQKARFFYQQQSHWYDIADKTKGAKEAAVTLGPNSGGPNAKVLASTDPAMVGTILDPTTGLHGSVTANQGAGINSNQTLRDGPNKTLDHTDHSADADETDANGGTSGTDDYETDDDDDTFASALNGTANRTHSAPHRLTTLDIAPYTLGSNSTRVGPNILGYTEKTLTPKAAKTLGVNESQKTPAKERFAKQLRKAFLPKRIGKSSPIAVKPGTSPQLSPIATQNSDVVTSTPIKQEQSDIVQVATEDKDAKARLDEQEYLRKIDLDEKQAHERDNARPIVKADSPVPLSVYQSIKPATFIANHVGIAGEVDDQYDDDDDDDPDASAAVAHPAHDAKHNATSPSDVTAAVATTQEPVETEDQKRQRHADTQAVLDRIIAQQAEQKQKEQAAQDAQTLKPVLTEHHEPLIAATVPDKYGDVDGNRLSSSMNFPKVNVADSSPDTTLTLPLAPDSSPESFSTPIGKASPGDHGTYQPKRGRVDSPASPTTHPTFTLPPLSNSTTTPPVTTDPPTRPATAQEPRKLTAQLGTKGSSNRVFPSSIHAGASNEYATPERQRPRTAFAPDLPVVSVRATNIHDTTPDIQALDSLTQTNHTVVKELNRLVPTNTQDIPELETSATGNLLKRFAASARKSVSSVVSSVKNKASDGIAAATTYAADKAENLLHSAVAGVIAASRSSSPNLLDDSDDSVSTIVPTRPTSATSYMSYQPGKSYAPSMQKVAHDVQTVNRELGSPRLKSATTISTSPTPENNAQFDEISRNLSASSNTTQQSMHPFGAPELKALSRPPSAAVVRQIVLDEGSKSKSPAQPAVKITELNVSPHTSPHKFINPTKLVGFGTHVPSGPPSTEYAYVNRPVVPIHNSPGAVATPQTKLPPLTPATVVQKKPTRKTADHKMAEEYLRTQGLEAANATRTLRAKPANNYLTNTQKILVSEAPAAIASINENKSSPDEPSTKKGKTSITKK